MRIKLFTLCLIFIYQLPVISQDNDFNKRLVLTYQHLQNDTSLRSNIYNYIGKSNRKNVKNSPSIFIAVNINITLNSEKKYIIDIDSVTPGSIIIYPYGIKGKKKNNWPIILYVTRSATLQQTGYTNSKLEGIYFENWPLFPNLQNLLKKECILLYEKSLEHYFIYTNKTIFAYVDGTEVYIHNKKWKRKKRKAKLVPLSEFINNPPSQYLQELINIYIYHTEYECYLSNHIEHKSNPS